MDCRTAGYLHGYTLKEAQNITDPLKKPSGIPPSPQVSPVDTSFDDFGMEQPPDAALPGTVGGVLFEDPAGTADQGFSLAGTSPQKVPTQVPPSQNVPPVSMPGSTTQGSTMRNSVAGMPDGDRFRKTAALQIILKRK